MSVIEWYPVDISVHGNGPIVGCVQCDEILNLVPLHAKQLGLSIGAVVEKSVYYEVLLFLFFILLLRVYYPP